MGNNGRKYRRLIRLRSILFQGHVEDTDPAVAPLCHRIGDCLKNHFKDAKNVFNAALDRWVLSGQNDPEKFVDFIWRNG